jgi:hypothetical protein
MSSALPRQDRGDYTCDDCDEALEYTGEQARTARDRLMSKYRCPNPDCTTEEVLLR